MKFINSEQEAGGEMRNKTEGETYELVDPAMKSFGSIEDQLRIVRRYAGKIDDKSTKIYIGSFRSNLNEIRTAYRAVELLYEDISKLSMQGQKTEIDSMERGLYYGKVEQGAVIGEKKNAAEPKVEQKNFLAEIKWEIESGAKDVLAKIELSRIAIKFIQPGYNDASIIDDAFLNLASLNEAMKKLFEVGKKMEEYSKG